MKIGPGVSKLWVSKIALSHSHGPWLIQQLVLLPVLVQLMYDRSFSVNGWLTAEMIYLLPLISVPSLVLPAVLNVFISLII